MKKDRMKKVLQSMEQENMEQLIITDAPSIYYLTDLWIHSQERMLALVLSLEKEPILIVNELFPLRKDLSVRVVRYKDTDDPIRILGKYIMDEKITGIDKNWSAHFLIGLMKTFPKLTVENGSYIVDRIRMIKDPLEIEKMKAVSRINDQAMEALFKEIPKGLTEKQMTRRLAEIYQDLGAEGFSFDPIVAYGKNGANPHHSPGDDRPQAGDSVLIDIGCHKDSYTADMTRTVFYQRMSKKQEEIYRIVQEANASAIRAVRPGATFSDIDTAAREVIEKKGYGKYFTHRTGHSIGIEVHEYGDVSGTNREEMQEGMIFSIEPGIYLSENVGVRIEDLVLVTEQGAEVLNHVTKEPVIVE
jgi:Xaa-Pro dipeptidase